MIGLALQAHIDSRIVTTVRRRRGARMLNPFEPTDHQHCAAANKVEFAYVSFNAALAAGHGYESSAARNCSAVQSGADAATARGSRHRWQAEGRRRHRACVADVAIINAPTAHPIKRLR